MKIRIFVLVVCAFACSFNLTAGDLRVEMLRPTADDLAAVEIRGEALTPTGLAVSRDPVHFSWKLAADSELSLRPEPPFASSREYRIQVDGAALSRGVSLPTTAPGALIRINPEQPVGSDSAFAIHPHSLQLTTPDGQRLDAEDAARDMATAEQLKAAGAPFAEGTTAFRLRDELGAGEYVLAAPDLARDDSTYLIHVFEAASELSAELGVGAMTTLGGRPIDATLAIRDSRAKPQVEEIAAWVVSPRGERSPVAFEAAASGELTAHVVLPNGAEGNAGLWELQAHLAGTRDGQTFRRDVRAAFGCAIPTARLLPDAATARAIDRADRSARQPAGRSLRFTVEAAAAGRYELRGVLFGSAVDGSLQPMAVAHSAAWLEPGTGALDLVFSSESLAGSELGPPFELRDLQLLDQGRMGVLHRQARALVIH